MPDGTDGVLVTDRWRQFIKDASRLAPYGYPLTDDATDGNLERQDPGMRGREQSLYTEWSDHAWDVAVDFGCGTGANFPCFDRQGATSSLLIGLEIDAARARVAEERAGQLRYVEATVARADVSLLEGSPDDLFADLVLCSQVLGHVPKQEIGRILRVFAANLRRGGSCAVSLPVVGDAFARDPSAGGWEPRVDFTHLVNFECSHLDSCYRTRVPDDVFDENARAPRENLLPVRCFWTSGLPDVSPQDLPVEVDTIPATLGREIGDAFDVSSAVLYSMHETQVGAQSAIGDMLIILGRK